MSVLLMCTYGILILEPMRMWSATDELCPLTKLVNNSLLELHSANDNIIARIKTHWDERTRKIKTL